MNANKFARWTFSLTLALVLLAAAAATAQAQSRDTRASWMAASSNEAVLSGNTWGRLTLIDGALTFQSPNYSWRIALPEITRIQASKEAARAFVVETVTGQRFYVAILDGTMTVASPGKTIQMLQRAVREAPPTISRPTMVAAGGSSDDR